MEEDRRKFLEKFVALSTISFALTGAGCVYGPPPSEVVYGPPPSENNDSNSSLLEMLESGDASIITISIYLKDENEEGYTNTTDLPLDFHIEIDFSSDMDSNARNRFKLLDIDNNEITTTKIVETTKKIRIIPTIDELNYNTKYELDIKMEAFDDNEKLVIYDINPKANTILFQTEKENSL